MEANGSRGGANKAKQTEERTFPTKTKGVVDEVNLLSVRTRKDFTELIIKNGDDKVHIYLCPKPFQEEMGISFSKGDEIAVTCSKVKQDASDGILARELVKGTDTLQFAVAYSFGFRKSELLEMRCNQVDLAGQTIRLWRGTTKSGEPRLVRMTREVLMLLTACLLGKASEDFVFSRNGGMPILDFRGRWDVLCEASGLDGLLFHDLRRSAVRNMIRSGISEAVAMRISGHKTRSVFDRYNVTSEADLTDAARKIEAGADNSYDLATITLPRTKAKHVSH